MLLPPVCCANTAMVHSMVATVSNIRLKSFLLVMLQKYEFYLALPNILAENQNKMPIPWFVKWNVIYLHPIKIV
jgi:hypothetical protein